MAEFRPNILFYMADDHAFESTSCYRAYVNSTPYLDPIATEGMNSNHCYVNNSICTPSRAAHIPNVVKQLRVGGYQTAMVKKWPLGEGKDHKSIGVDHWRIVHSQGEYHDPQFIPPNGIK
ncbi:uncharacterized protein N7477_000586 [Penicillium maclennaniae]|uniref:uncharacterized protein n=1 Tax=Penicillium maclennaniae TaxID=1343394 RepID=UPI00253F99D8|nr:uncharacterized protein N7477_000586 [Penicillium maclennaniae]KAJ5684241.1 hypothetical protein N7477_000586 [Penicillium maclennaniae]